MDYGCRPTQNLGLHQELVAERRGDAMLVEKFRRQVLRIKHIQRMHEAVEEHYGADYAFAQRRAGLLQIVAQIIAVLGVVAALVTWFVNEYDSTVTYLRRLDSAC